MSDAQAVRASWSIVLCFAFGGRPSPTPPTVALVSDMAVEPHHQAAEAFTQISDARVVRVGPSQPWPDAARPDVVVAVGDVADAAASRRWPDTPRASISMIGEAPSVAKMPDHGPPRLWSSAHTEPTCTAAQLRAVSGGDWIVVASPTDDDAQLLSDALDAELVRGTPAEIARTLRDRARPGGHIWIRGAAGMAIPEWLAFLGRMSRLGGPRIGFDLPGGARWGLPRWVRPDHLGVARSTEAWVDRVTGPRRGAPPPLTLETAPCRRTSSDPHHD